ncbi:Homeobox protein tos8 [Entomophthora muscae]|uniref:Homeobox protein tos8 n=1 Tax=Entomophthora muscae TaxID=34485 RepID=A0ACC2THH3_9FUNG|nr:Homeobox protein tos8 [Entomophthora muscae]
MDSPVDRTIIDAIKAHPLYTPILKLTILWNRLTLSGEVDIVHHLAEALYILKDSIIALPTQSIEALPEGHTRILINITLYLMREVFKIYQLRRSAQGRVAYLIENLHVAPSPKSRETSSSANEKKTKHDPAVVNTLREWLFNHTNNPYPTPEEKEALYKKTHLTPNQLNDWFVNARRRILKRS